MHTDHPQVQSESRIPIPNAAVGIGHFVVHFIEMCLVMCIGGGMLSVLVFYGAIALGYPDLVRQAPELATLLLAINLTIPMMVWMRFRRHAWGLTLEMAGTSLVLAAFLIGARGLGLLAAGDVFQWEKALACPLMLVPMLLRYDHYAGRHAHHGRG